MHASLMVSGDSLSHLTTQSLADIGQSDDVNDFHTALLLANADNSFKEKANAAPAQPR
jgi:hypothetical protein